MRGGVLAARPYVTTNRIHDDKREPEAGSMGQLRHRKDDGSKVRHRRRLQSGQTSASFKKCLILGNEAQFRGGVVDSQSSSSVSFTSCVIKNNNALKGGVGAGNFLDFGLDQHCFSRPESI